MEIKWRGGISGCTGEKREEEDFASFSWVLRGGSV